MDVEIKDRWTTALRSGDYAQTTGVLNDGDGFCCLGVLCEIAEKDQVVIRIDADPGTRYVSKVDSEDASRMLLPRAVVSWSGMPGVEGNEEFKIKEEDVPESVKGSDALWGARSSEYTTTLTALNDNGASFDEIATVIEKYF
jgi:hypothetical protein